MSLKKLEPPTPNYMLLTLNPSYDESFVLPYKDGIAVLAAMENAKIYKKGYQEESTIRDTRNSDIKASSIGAQEHGEAILRATLLAKAEGE